MEKFGVSLEMVIEKFKEKAKQAQDVSKNVANKIKDNMSVDVGGGAFSGMTAESELLLNKIGDLKETLDDPVTSKVFDSYDILDMRVELEKLERQYDKINSSSNMFSSSFNKIQEGMNKSLKSAKRFTLSLFGIQSIYRMLSRASSAYLAQDTETSSKIQSAWIGLGSIFAPLLQTVANFTIKAVSYINVFIKALTGTDFLANAMAKSMDKASKSAKKLSKTLAGFDEITNLDASTSAGADASWIDAYKDVKLNQNVVRKLQDLAKWLKENKELIEAVGIALGITFGAVAIGKILGGIGSLMGSKVLGTGLVGLSGILGGLATMGAIAISVYFVGKIFQEAKELREEMEKIRIAGQEGYSNWVKETKDIEKIYNSMNAHRTSTEESLDNTNNWIYKITRNSDTWLDIAGGIARTSQDNLDRIKELYGVEIKTKEEKQKALGVLKEQLDTLYKVREEYTMQGRDTKEIDETISNYASTLDDISADLNISSSYTKDMNDWMRKTDINAGKLYKTMSKIAGLGGGSSFGGGGFGGGGLGGGGFAKGLDVVPFDGMYLLHKNETVVPAKFTPSMHGLGNGGNQELISEIRAMREDIQRIEINPYTTIKDVGSASVSYINNQGRIMGRGVI